MFENVLFLDIQKARIVGGMFGAGLCCARGLSLRDKDYEIAVGAPNIFARIAFGDGGFVAAVLTVKPNKWVRLTHFQSCLSGALKGVPQTRNSAFGGPKSE